MNKMPVLFVGHGSPMNALDAENPFNQGFRRIAQKFAKPKAILMISAHWYGNRLQVTSGERPEMIYDFYGFPAALSQVQYPAPGSPNWRGRCARCCSLQMWKRTRNAASTTARGRC